MNKQIENNKKTAKKNDPKIIAKNSEKKELETPQNKETNIEETATPSQDIELNQVKEDDIIKVLKVPVQEAQTSQAGTTEFNDVNDDLNILEGGDKTFDEEENLNDDFNKKDQDEFDFMFSDHKLMSEIAVELLDMGMITLCMSLSGEFGEEGEQKYGVSDYRKNKIKKPLELLLAKRDKKISPELMFVLITLVVYSPSLIMAWQVRKEKKKVKVRKKQVVKGQPNIVKPDAMRQPPVDVKPTKEEVSNVPLMNTKKDVEEIKPEPKSKGRPKGSLNKKTILRYADKGK